MTFRCSTCGFDEADWDDTDLVRTLGRTDYLLRHAEADLPESLALPVAELERHVQAVAGIDHDADVANAHRLLHRCWEIAELRAAAGDLPAEQHGRVEQLNVSNGGVPKRPVPEFEVGRRGPLNDHQRFRRHHGRVWQALCLWSAEVIEALQAEGHPIGYGSAGENVTVRGIAWSALRSGTLAETGPVGARLTVAAEPSSQNAEWLPGGDCGRMDHGPHPGWSRWSATVERGGIVRHGDPVVLAPRS